MRKSLLISAICIGALTTGFAFAAPPAGAPAGSTGLCKDGSYYSGPVKKGACRGHQGVKDWWGAETGGAATAPAATPPAAPAASSSTSAPPAAMPAPARPSAAMPTQPAAGGGPGQVWVNSSTKVYHCPGDKWYGKTKAGSYMTEADAKAKGYHADHGKPCQ